MPLQKNSKLAQLTRLSFSPIEITSAFAGQNCWLSIFGVYELPVDGGYSCGGSTLVPRAYLRVCERTTAGAERYKDACGHADGSGNLASVSVRSVRMLWLF